MASQSSFQSTSPVRGTTAQKRYFQQRFFISIHVPREGDDGVAIKSETVSGKFQSTSPVRGTTNQMQANAPVFEFQSTSPVRGTTF